MGKKKKIQGIFSQWPEQSGQPVQPVQSEAVPMQMVGNPRGQLLPSVQAQSPYEQARYVQTLLPTTKGWPQPVTEDQENELDINYFRKHGAMAGGDRDPFNSLPMWQAMKATRAADQGANTNGFWYGGDDALADRRAQAQETMQGLNIRSGDVQTEEAKAGLPSVPSGRDRASGREFLGDDENMRILSMTAEGRRFLRGRGILPEAVRPAGSATRQRRGGDAIIANKQKQDERAALNYYKAQGIPATKAMLPALQAMENRKSLTPHEEAMYLPSDKYAAGKQYEAAINPDNARAAGLGMALQQAAPGTAAEIAAAYSSGTSGGLPPVAKTGNPVVDAVMDSLEPGDAAAVMQAIQVGGSEGTEVIRRLARLRPDVDFGPVYGAMNKDGTSRNPTGSVWGATREFLKDVAGSYATLPEALRSSLPSSQDYPSISSAYGLPLTRPPKRQQNKLQAAAAQGGERGAEAQAILDYEESVWAGRQKGLRDYLPSGRRPF